MPTLCNFVFTHKVCPGKATGSIQACSLAWTGQSQLLRWLQNASLSAHSGFRKSTTSSRNSDLGKHLRSGGSRVQALGTAEYTSAGPAFASPTSTTKICILGGGFGGLYTAIRLQSLLWPQGNRPQVTLVDKGDRFVFKPLLYEVVNGTAKVEEVAPPFVKLLAPYTVNFVQASVQSIEPHNVSSESRSLAGGKIVLNDGSSLEYDWLVLSLGSETSTLGVPGAKEYAYVFNTINDAVQVQRNVELLENAAGSEVVVVGSGPAGVELATTIADRLGSMAHIHLISTGPQILKGVPSTHRAAAEHALQEKGISIVRNSLVTQVKEGRRGGAAGTMRRLVEIKDQSGYKRDLEADLVLWTAGSQPSSKAAPNMRLPFPTTESGALKTDDTLRVLGHPRVFALGDVAGAASNAQELASIPNTAQVAFQQADYAAWNVWAAIHNRPLLPFRYQHLGDMMSLGKSDGAVTLPISIPRELSSALQSSPFGSVLSLAGIRLGSADDKGVTFEGTLGALIRRAAYLYRQPTSEHMLEVGSSWLQQALGSPKRATEAKE